MIYRRLGRTKLQVSVIGLGTWQFGGEWGKKFEQSEVNAMFDRARELGINLIDTAECYGNHVSEQLVGHAIRKDRDRWIVATKFGHRFHGHLDRTDERSAAQVLQQLEDSLKALQTDHIDLYQFHSVRDSEFNDAELRAVLDRAVKAGKVRFIGNSISAGLTTTGPNYQVEHSAELNVAAIQVVYNRLDRDPEHQILPSCLRQDLGVLARVPLASGLLSGKYKSGAKFPADDVRNTQDRAKVESRLRDVELIEANELPAGVPMAAWALAWCLRNPAVTAVIPGCKDIAQVESNAKAAELVDPS